MPAVSAEQPAGDGRGRDDGERLAQVPECVGPRAFGAGKPVREQNQRGGKNAAFGNTEQKARDFKLAKGFRQAAADGADAPKNQAQADELFGAPFSGEVAADHLQ